MELNGRVAAITGASAGIGLACAERLAREGVAVVLGARRRDRLDAAVANIRARGGRAEAVDADVAVEADMVRMVRCATSMFGRIDIMICNAGFGFYGPLDDTPADVMRRMMDVNFMGTFHGARAAVPAFVAQAHGHLIIMSSVVGRRGIGQMSGYSATKAAQVGFAESLRAELAGTGVHVSVVFPVSTETEFRQAMERDYGHSVAGLGPKQTADDVAGAVIACLKNPHPEVWPYRAAKLLGVLNAIAPAFTDRFVKRFGRRREKRT